jgi:transcriptional regulator with XRE-family HTH domain
MGMTLEKLAEALDTDFRVLSRYENGQAEMGAVMYRNLIQLYEQRTARADLLQQIKKLSPQNQQALKTIISSLAGI